MSEIWHFIKGDTYTDGRLQTIKQYYLDKIFADVAELAKLLNIQRYGLPGWRWMMVHSKMEWDNNTESLKNVVKAIKAGQGIKDSP